MAVQPNHSSRRKPVQVWQVTFGTDEGEETRSLFWYKKDAERYLLEHANEFAADDAAYDGTEPVKFKSIDPALKYLNSESTQFWELEQVTVQS